MTTNKSVTLVEIDVDEYRITQFSGVASGQTPSGWSSSWAGSSTLTGVLDADYPSGRGVRITNTGSNRRLWRWTLPSSFEDASAIIGVVGVPTVGQRAGIALRASGSGGSESGYLLVVKDNSTVAVASIKSGTYAELATEAITVADADLVWMRFDAITTTTGVTIRGKVWTGDLNDEPVLFTVSAEDTSSPISSAGWSGIYKNDAGSADVVHFRVRSFLSDTLETMRFALAADYLPPEFDAIPSCTGVTHNPMRIALGESLGKRATVSANFTDHRGADRGELFGQGSFWGKFRARSLFRRGLPMRIKRGLAGQSIDDYETRYYVCETFNGPTAAGAFTITAQDVLKLADNDRAQAPALSNGFLVSSVTSSATSATLSPSGIGNLEYPSSGYAAIGGEEIVSFTRSGDVLTLTRAQYGTTAVAHDAEDRVQVCLRYNGETPAAIINDLLVNYAGVDSSAIPLATWELEVSTYLARVYSRLIAEPTGVKKLIDELIEQAGLALWTDDSLETEQIRLQVLRAINTSAFTYEPGNVMAGSTQVAEQPASRLTQVWTYYGVRNPLQSLSDPSNFRSSLYTIDGDAESLYGSAVIHKTFGTWIPAFGRTTASRVNNLQLSRFTIPPRKFTFDVMRYGDTPLPSMGGGYNFKYWGGQDETGNEVPIPIQVTQLNPQGDRVRVEAEEMRVTQYDEVDLTDRTLIIDTDELNFNLKAAHDSVFPALVGDTSGITVNCYVNAGVVVGSSSTASPAFDVGDFPDDVTINVYVSGRIQAAGGNGGSVTSSGQTAGTAGGTALYTRQAINLTYTDGEIWGGGGGGKTTYVNIAGVFAGGGGGGGSGYVAGNGGTSNGSGSVGGSAGTRTAGGAGGTSGSLTGGAGGAPGAAGGTGSGGGTSGTAGAAGTAIDGISYITVVGTVGDRQGAQIN